MSNAFRLLLALSVLNLVFLGIELAINVLGVAAG